MGRKLDSIRINNETIYSVSARFQELKDSMPEVIEEIEDSTVNERLTYKQRIFVTHFCNTTNGMQSAILAGIAPAHANEQAARYLKTPKIQKAIIKRLNSLAFIAAINKETVLTELFEIYQNLQDNTTDYTLQVKVLELIAKLNGYYQPEQQINIQDNSVGGIKIQIVNTNGTVHNEGRKGKDQITSGEIPG